MKIINNSIPEILSRISLGEEWVEKIIPEKEKPAGKGKIKFGIPKIENKEEFLKELEIKESLLKKIKKKRYIKEEKVSEFKKARGYLKWANRMFFNNASSLIKKGYFRNLSLELKKSNLEILLESYVAMMFFSVLISFFVAVFLTLFLMFFDLSFAWPFIKSYEGAFLSRTVKVIWILLALPFCTFAALYYYPTAEKKAISRRIDEELPFAVIQMSAISGSGIEPTEIFKIIGLSKDYPFLRKEIRKILNQINIYGYDLVTALNNVSKTTSSQKLAELFGGLSTTINSGGSLYDFFQKRSETLLIGYKLEKEKAIKVAETFMDIYISVVIAAPMILMLMLVMISISGIQIGFTPYQLTFMTIGGVAFINIIFLVYLQAKR